MENLLTVVIPIYNGEKYILRALESLKNQTWKLFNILIIDDASTDGTPSIVEQFAKYNKNSTLIRLSKNHGPSYCRNLGIKKCRTEYITFLDCDDWIDIDTYENCFKSIRPDSDILIFGLNYDYIDLDISESKYVYNSNYSIEGNYALKIYGHTTKDSFKITPIVNNKIYRLNLLLLNNIEFSNKLRFQEDDIFTFKCLMFASNVLFISRSKYHYFQNRDSVIHQVSELSVKHFVFAYKTLKDFLEKKSCFINYKTEFYLKFKASFKGKIHRIIKYSKNQEEANHLLSLLYKTVMETFNIEELLSYFDFHQLL